MNETEEHYDYYVDKEVVNGFAEEGYQTVLGTAASGISLSLSFVCICWCARARPTKVERTSVKLRRNDVGPK